ncbi:DUF1990 family protein [Rhodococcus sp. X156]|uniref:DUF1990 family protein n=1 Tax=Rhodococcus sp. X156 TaxID=2499145 RepID=UPI000FD9AA1C|nr:DUF1990 family protein [Rhodococcus sp. X156]
MLIGLGTERGIERFTVELTPEGVVTGPVQASPPVWPVLRPLGPAPRWVQRCIAALYPRRLQAR